MKRQWGLYHFLTLLIILFVSWIRESTGALSGWSSSPTQYHIQNDEGSDRFFRYQTFNGQYRKERRMDDGTVIGSYGWVDPSGFLRMTDYIADEKGYRIVKSRKEFVGVKPEPSSESQEKQYKPMKHSIRVVRQRNSEQFLTSSVAPTSLVEFTTLSAPPQKSISRPQGQGRPEKELDLHLTPPKSLHIKPTTTSSRRRLPKRKIIKVFTRRQLPKNSTAFPNVQITTPSPYPSPEFQDSRPLITHPPPISPEFTGSRPYIIQVIRGNERTGGRNDVFKGYATPLRNGNGFLYKIPNQYHKEETENDGSKVGSFGYVDPFGIRRVIHYNAGTTGFAHEVDFKYVGKNPSNGSGESSGSGEASPLRN